MTEELNLDDLMDQVVLMLRNCYDPEIPVNIYDLGLIYEVNVNELGEVEVVMTLTSPACPVAGTLPGEVEQKIKQIPRVKEAIVKISWDPPWDASMMNEEARLELGLM